MARKQFKVSRRMLFTWFMLGGLILLLAPHNLTNNFQFAFARIFRVPLSIGRNISLAAHTQRQFLDVVARVEYNQLQNHLANITELLNQEHQKLEKLSALRNRFPLEGARLMPADIITASIDKLRSELLINRGADDGLAKGQFVLSDNSIIGTVSDVKARTAQVKLVTDPAYKIKVKIVELNIETLMQGYGDNLAKIRMLPVKHKVQPGDKVLACKKPGLLDTAMIIGTIAECERSDENPLLWDITVKPACDIKAIKDVAVIIMNPQEN